MSFLHTFIVRLLRARGTAAECIKCEQQKMEIKFSNLHLSGGAAPAIHLLIARFYFGGW